MSTHETWEETLEVETKLLVEAKAGINDKYLNLVTSFDTPELNSFIPRVSKRARTPSTRQKDLEARCSELFFDNRDLRDEIIELKKQLADVTHSQPSYDVYRAKYDPKRVV